MINCYCSHMDTMTLWEAADADAIEAADAAIPTDDDWAWYLEATYVDPAERAW